MVSATARLTHLNTGEAPRAITRGASGSQCGEVFAIEEFACLVHHRFGLGDLSMTNSANEDCVRFRLEAFLYLSLQRSRRTVDERTACWSSVPLKIGELIGGFRGERSDGGALSRREDIDAQVIGLEQGRIR